MAAKATTILKVEPARIPIPSILAMVSIRSLADGIGMIKFGTLAAEGRSGVTDGKDWVKSGNT